MIVLGLGTNCGRRYQHLRTAISHLAQLSDLKIINTSPIYESEALLPENAPKDWCKNYLNMAVSCESILSPEALLQQLKNIEKAMGRNYYARWSPRIIDIDILAWDDLLLKTDRLNIPHIGLEDRPFALWPLLDLTPNWRHPVWQKKANEAATHWGSRFTGMAPLKTRQVNADILETQLMGAVNVTHDSFSDGGLYLDPDKAYAQVVKLVEAGANVIDIGAESTNPVYSKPITTREEWSRLKPVLDRIQKTTLKVKLSVDTRNPETAHKALDLGVDILNDVSGFSDLKMIALAKEYNVELVMMHSLGIPADPNVTIPLNQDPVKVVFDWGIERIRQLCTAGIEPKKIYFDVGVGQFGKTAEQSIAILKNINKFHELGVKLCVGHSRKSFFSLVTDLPYNQRDLETAVLSNYLAKQNTHLLRVHDVLSSRRAIRLADFF